MFAVSTLAHALGLGGLFMARAFAPLLVLSLVTRFAAHDARGAQYGLAPLAVDALPWFVDERFMLVCGGLAALECLANHSVTVRAWLRRHDVVLKAAAAVVAALGTGIARDRGRLAELIGDSIGNGGRLALARDPELRRHIEPALICLVVCVLVLALGLLRRGMLQRLAERERDDPLGVGWLIVWIEELWSVLGPSLFVANPLTALSGLLVGLLVQLRLRSALRVRDDDDQVLCVCGQPNYRTAPRCASCGGRNASPACVGAFGQSTQRFETDLDAQARALFEARRCPRCATPLAERAPTQFCTACGQAAPPDAEFVGDYDRMVRRRKLWTLLGTALWGALPLVGLIPGIFIAHRRLTAPYARYVRGLRSWLVRVALRLGWLVAIVVQLVPDAGIVGLPLMSYASHRAYRATFLRDSLAGEGEPDDDW